MSQQTEQNLSLKLKEETENNPTFTLLGLKSNHVYQRVITDELYLVLKDHDGKYLFLLKFSTGQIFPSNIFRTDDRFIEVPCTKIELTLTKNNLE